jgi:hypothetical protein
VNCVGCGVAGHAVGTPDWCRCCGTQPQCFLLERPNIYDQASCLANDGFCSTQCLVNGSPDPVHCSNGTTTAPSTTTTINTETSATDPVTEPSTTASPSQPATEPSTADASTTTAAASTTRAPTTAVVGTGCIAVTKPTGTCAAPAGLLQHNGLASLCAQVDGGNIDLPAEAQACRPECITAASRLICALVCQKCVNNSTLVHNRVCSDSCEAVDAACGLDCATHVYSQFGGRAGVCGLVVSGCAPRLDAHAIKPVTEVDLLIPGLLVGLGVGLPLLCGLLILLFLCKQARIEPHGEEEDGPSHWVGTVKPTPEAVAAADESIERGRRAKAAGAHEDTSSLDFDEEDDEPTKKGDKKKAAAAAAAKGKAAKKEESESGDEEYSYEYVTETLSGEDDDKESDESEEEESEEEEETEESEEEEETEEETEETEEETEEEEEESEEEEEEEEEESSEKPKKKSSKK